MPEGLASRDFANWTVIEKFRWYAGRQIIVYSLTELDEKYDDAIREPLNKGATPPRNSPISEETLNLQASTLDLISDSLGN